MKDWKKVGFFLLMLMSCQNYLFSQTHIKVPKEDPYRPGVNSQFGYWEYLPKNYNSNSNTWPIIVWLHGLGPYGNGTTDLDLLSNKGIPRLINKGWDFPFLIMSPQHHSGWWKADEIWELLEYLKTKYKIDESRIYLTGQSSGGVGVWRFIGAYPDYATAVVPIAGNGNTAMDDHCVLKNIPVWAFHGSNDGTVSPYGSIKPIEKMNACIPPPAVPGKVTIYPGVGHNSWDRTYDGTGMGTEDPNYDAFDITVFDWFLQHTKKKVSVDLGQDRSITLPTKSINLSSSINAPNPITTYAWAKRSGPSATLVNANTSTLTVNSMVEGTYIFRLTVTDNQGNTGFDEVTVTVLPEIVNQAPVANAGADQIIALPTNLAVFNGSGSDSDGSIASYSWTKISGPAATLQNQNTASLTVSGLTEGTYIFRLTVTDDEGASGYDDVSLTVETANISPTVNAGSNKTIQLPTNTIVINGSASDPDGTISTYQWSKRSGPTATLQNATTANLTATNLLQGTYLFRLTATDNDGAAAYDEVSVFVQAVNQAPVANAGADQNLKLPVNSTTINGSGNDADGSIVSYSWIKVNGPSATLTNASKATLSLSNLLQGTYTFGLTVTDDDGATGYDEVKITVDAANVNPIANAGDDIILYLPTNSTTINGIGTDADGSIATYQWLKKSGPSVTLTNANSANLTINNVVEGTYTFSFKVTDNEGATATDEVTVFALVSNTPPTANAGSDKNITLPTNSLNLSGSGNDSDGSIASYSWSNVSGPSVTITGASTSTLQLTNLVQGTYIFGLTVSDDDGATGYDEVKVIVAPEPVNIAPNVTASNDAAITLPTNSVNLTSNANDPDGSIVSYLWAKISGPSANISSPGTANTSISNLVAGSYVFRITVTDNDGAKASDNVNVTVYEQNINQNPVVNAGANITIRLPENNVTFNPNVTDDGTIVSYEWIQLTGPNSATFNSAIKSPTVSGLIAGVYTFRLTATDDQGASSSDEISVNVAEENQAPTVNAGSDIMLQLPTNSVNITATANDPDGNIVSYLWVRISGQNGETISGTNSATASITNLSQGIYVFQVTVTDNEGATGIDQVKVTIQAENIIPTANAGGDIEIQLPINSANINGAGGDVDGTIVSYEWSKESGPMVTLVNQNSATLTLNDLLEGIYIFRLTVTDNDGASNFDDVVVTVLPELINALPVANAGQDKQIALPTNTASFNGSGTDSDGTIVSYSWIKISGPSVTLSNTNSSTLSLSNLVEGIYTFRLTVTDNDNATGSDDVKLIVNPELVNENPIAYAGADHIVTLPTNSLNINGSGSDTDGTIVAYLWEKVSGPTLTMSNTNNPVLVLSDLVEGSYSFRLTVTDDEGATASDGVNVTVNSEVINQAPTASAGPNQNIKLPTNSVVLNGSGSDADGSIVNYSWIKISGPNVSMINADYATLTINSLVEGNYVFRLTVVDDDGLSGSDEVKVIVVGANVNSNPVVNAGKDKRIKKPTSDARISAEAYDLDGTIVSYQWEQINGELTSMSDPTQPSITLSNLDIGTYSYRITVTDNDGASDFDEINLTVDTDDVNLAPVADAGQDIQIFMPTNSANVTGTGSDIDGSIISYSWVKISGPSVSMTNANNPTVSFTDMIEGQYTFRFTVTDNDGGTAQDELIIYVTAETVNQSPIADAGENIELYLPNNSVAIQGGGNDVDGEIISYSWEKTSGPDGTVIGTENAKLELFDLVEGMYEYRLTVTDNENATGSDYVLITVNPEGTNIPPTVDLGNNINKNLPIDSLVIDGVIGDSDGEIISYSWSKLSGANIVMEENDGTLILKNIIAGTYIFRLTIEDDGGATAFDDIIVTINPAGTNRNPQSNAGSDLNITLPLNTITIFGSGSDPDGDELTFEWSQLSGPSIVALEGIDNAELHLAELIEGSYVFELIVTDSKGASSSDRVRLVVEPENIPPIANAGEDIVLNLPVDGFIHVGSGIDEDGLIISYQWRMVSGPMVDNSIINSDTLLLDGLIEGEYIYELTVLDNDSIIAIDEVLVQVFPGDLSGLGAHKVFSPDGNGIDDYWEIDNLDLISGCQLTIFNRFGAKVYESNNYQNEWDGTYNGSALPEGAYYFIIKCGDGSDTASGGIRIIRDY